MNERKFHLYVWNRERWVQHVGGDDEEYLIGLMTGLVHDFGRPGYIYEIRRGDKVLHRTIIQMVYTVNPNTQ